MSSVSNEEEYVDIMPPKHGIIFEDNASYGLVDSSSRERLDEVEDEENEYCQVQQFKRSMRGTKARPLVGKDQDHEYSQIQSKSSGKTGSTDNLVVDAEQEDSYTPMVGYSNFREEPCVPARQKMSRWYRVALALVAVVMLCLLLVLLTAGTISALVQISELQTSVKNLQRNDSIPPHNPGL